MPDEAPLIPKSPGTQVAALAGGSGLLGVCVFLVNSLISLEREVQVIRDQRETALEELNELNDDVDQLNGRLDALFQILGEAGIHTP